MFKKGDIAAKCLSITYWLWTKGGEKRSGGSRWIQGYTFTEEGIVYANPNPLGKGKAEYLDYRTGKYMPLCDKVNCLHNSKECFAVHVGGDMGRIGDKWYYKLPSEENGMPVFYCCDLNGQNEKKIGEFPHSGTSTALYFDDSCIADTDDPVFDEETGTWVADNPVSVIYQYHFDTGEEEVLRPETDAGLYELYGMYGGQLVYRLKKDGCGFLEFLDLETGEITKPLGDRKIMGPVSMKGDLFACTLLEGGIRRVIELELKSGEWKETVPELTEVSVLFWSDEMKTATVYEKGNLYKVYQYLGDGTCRLAREDDISAYREVLAINGDLVIGVSYYDMEAQFCIGVMKKEDYLAGKNKWTVLEY